MGEIACGNVKNRRDIILFLNDLPKVYILDHLEVMGFIESRGLMGMGVGYVDVHLLAAALLSNAPLWTRDKALASSADTLGMPFNL